VKPGSKKKIANGGEGSFHAIVWQKREYENVNIKGGKRMQRPAQLTRETPTGEILMRVPSVVGPWEPGSQERKRGDYEGGLSKKVNWKEKKEKKKAHGSERVIESKWVGGEKKRKKALVKGITHRLKNANVKGR